MIDGQQIRKLRLDLGVSQAELARATGTNRTILSGCETGQLVLIGDCERRLHDYFAHQGAEVPKPLGGKAAVPNGGRALTHAGSVPAVVSERSRELRVELREIEQRVRELENASLDKGFIDSFMERDKEEREELAVLTARWRVVVLELDGQPVPSAVIQGKPKTHAHALARAYDELCEENSG